MWDCWEEADWFFITNNPIITKAGKVVMGRGIAKQAKDRLANCDRHFADKLGRAGYNSVGIINYYPTDDSCTEWVALGWFMVKDHWQRPASLAIIQESSRQLEVLARVFPDDRFLLNMPGTGNGNRDREEVLPLLSSLPDNVEVWEYKR